MDNSSYTLIQHQAAEDYWMQKLKAVKIQPVFADLYSQENPGVNKKIYQWDLPFPDELQTALYSISKGIDTNIYLLFLTALNILLHKYSGADDILVGTTNFKRDNSPQPNEVLLFFRTAIEPWSIPRAVLNQALDELNLAYKHRCFDFDEFYERFCMNHTGEKEALYGLGLIYDAFNRESVLTDRFHLLFRVRQQDRKFSLLLRGNSDNFSLEQVRQLGNHFITVLNALLVNLDNPVQNIGMLSGEEKQGILDIFSGPHYDFPIDKPFHCYFQEQAAKTPHAAALVCDQHTVSYSQLNNISNQLARYLARQTLIREDDLVAVIMDRSERMVQSILAAWKSGCAYVPIDPAYPRERILTILNDSSVPLVLSEPGTISPGLEKHIIAAVKIVYPGELVGELAGEDSNNLDMHLQRSGRSLAYVIYTSGSTGKPKGAMVEHGGMMNHLLAKLRELQIDSNSIVAQNASQCFDISVWQFFVALMAGGHTIVYSDRMVLDPQVFLERLDAHSVTILEVVPSYLSLMLDLIDTRGLFNIFSTLNYLLVTGETVKPILVKRWFAGFPGIKMVNAYGPTEASDDITHCVMERCPDTKTIPIGKTVQNFNIYITEENDSMTLCPVGVKGEICVSGLGVGRGYLNNPELTAEKFDHDLWDLQDYQDKRKKAKKAPGKRNYNQKLLRGVQGGGFLEKSPPGRRRPKIYRTGDLGRFLWDGNIEFIGRKDHQVKIRGYRIETGEIESKLSGIAGIKDTAVVARQDKDNNSYLCAYVTFKEGRKKGPEEIKKELKNILPGYMVPGHIIELDVLPLTPNGKIDRKALPDPGGSQPGTANRYVAPGNAAEKKLAEIWEKVFGIDKIGIHDNFFDLGGDSLKGIRIVNKIQEWLDEVVHVTVLFLAPTIGKMAVKLDSYKHESGSNLDIKKVNEMRRIIQGHSLAPFPGSIESKNPPALFILSPPRSGSTLMRVILTGHPQLFAPQEMELLGFNTLKERKSALEGKFSFYLEGVIRAVMEIKGYSADEARAIMEKYENRGMSIKEFYGILAGWLGDKMLVEKTPSYTLDLEILNRMETYFENPFYIHLIRNPYAGILSFEEAKLDQLFKYHHDFSTRELAESVWLISHQNIVRFLKTIPENRKHTVKYEDLVTNPLSVVQGICKHLGVDYRQEMIHVYSNLENKMTDGIYQESKMLGDVKFLKHKRIDPNTAERWRKKFKKEFLSQMSTELAESFGYRDEIRIKTEEAGEPDRYENLVLMKEGNSNEKNLFFIHDGNGELEVYMEFCQNLDNGYNCWGIITDRKNVVGPRNLTIEEMASQYILKIKSLQAQGPYRVIGWCLAGTIAFEIVRQLEKSGEKVTFLAMFDVLATPGESVDEFTVESELNWINRYLPGDDIANKPGNVTDMNHLWQWIIETLAPGHLDTTGIREKIREYIFHDIPDFEQKSIEELIKRFNEKRTIRRARFLYQPHGKIKTPVYYFRAGNTKETNLEWWNHYFNNPAISYLVEGDHFSILRNPQVVNFARVFEESLKKK